MVGIPSFAKVVRLYGVYSGNIYYKFDLFKHKTEYNYNISVH